MRFGEIVGKYGIRFKKSLGQNLLLDDNINRIMVEAAELGPGDDVVEVGAGLGALTDHLGGLAGRVLAVEIDQAFMPCLEDRFRGRDNVILFRGDILNHDLEELLAEYLPGGTSYKMVSNLPYYVTTPILFQFWESGVQFIRMVVMVQAEVASRLGARVNSRDYGVLSVVAHYYGDVDVVHKVSRTCFRPVPKVDSCIVRLRGHEKPLYPDVDRAAFMGVVRTAFAQRRKMLRNSLARGGRAGISEELVLDALTAAGVEPGRRPQTLTLEEFVALTQAIEARRVWTTAGKSDEKGDHGHVE